MTDYVVMVRILGGEWEYHQVNGEDFSTICLAEALGQKATIESSIRETMVVAVRSTWENMDGQMVIVTSFEIVE